MGQSWVHLQGNPVIDWDSQTGADIAVANDLVEVTIVTLNCKMGKKPFLVSTKQAWEAGMDTFLSWSIRVNGNTHYKFPFSTAQMSPPETDYKLPVRLEVSQGDRITMVARMTAGGTNGNMTGVLQVEYEDY